MRPRVLFLIKLVAFSAVIFLGRVYVTKIYGGVLSIAAAVYLPLVKPGLQLETTGDSFFSVDVALLPLLALLLATPGVKNTRRILAALGGMLAILLIDLTILVPWGEPGMAPAQGSATYTVFRTLLLALPLVIWLVAAYNQVVLLVSAAVPERTEERRRICPICRKERIGLVEHIESAHGPKALKKWRVRRYLARVNLS